METVEKKYVVVIYSENQIGLLTQVANVFTRRSMNIWSLTASPSAIEGIHTIIIETVGIEKKIIESVQQLQKRVDVVRVFYYCIDEMIYRELALYKVPTEAIIESGNIEEILQRFNANIIEINKSYAVISKVGTTEESQNLYNELKDFGVMQFQRSGSIVISRERQEPLQEFLKAREDICK